MQQKHFPKNNEDCQDQDLLDKMDFREVQWKFKHLVVPITKRGRCFLYVKEMAMASTSNISTGDERNLSISNQLFPGLLRAALLKANS